MRRCCRPHHVALERVVAKILAWFGRCRVLDCHRPRDLQPLWIGLDTERDACKVGDADDAFMGANF